MPNPLKGVKVNGESYHFDHNFLDNNPVLSNELPVYDANNAGDALVVDSNGDLEWRSIESGGGSDLPPYDDRYSGRVLAVDDGGNLEWSGTAGIPSVDTNGDDDGKLLVVGNCGHVEWDYPEDAFSEAYDRLLPTTGNEPPYVLMQPDENSSIGWYSPNDIFPEFTDADNGKVLMIQDGEIAWGNPS